MNWQPSRVRALLGLMVAVLAPPAPSTVAAAEAAANRPPNIVWIMADDLGYGALGCFGQQKVATPRLDLMAAQGMRFTQCYAGSAECAPSRCAFLTGKHIGHARIRRNTLAPLRAQDVTFAQKLREAGYANGIFGKWGLGDYGTTGAPDRKGFDTFFGYLDQGLAHFYYPDSLRDGPLAYPLPGNAGGRRVQYSHDLIEARALEFIRQSRDRPFLAYMAFTIPHAELLVPDDSMAPYLGKFPETPHVETHYASQPTPRAAYAGMVSRLDRSVGRTLDLLAELGLDRRTLVIFTSDNGPTVAGGSDPTFFHNAGPLRGLKFSLYEGGIRVPTIARWPGTVPEGTVVETPWAFSDAFPTFCELAGVASPNGLDGRSIVPTLRGQHQPDAPGFYWEEPGKDGLMQAARLGDWKGIRNAPGAPLEVYNLRDDVGESRNLANDHPEIRDRLEAYLRDQHTEPDPE